LIRLKSHIIIVLVIQLALSQIFTVKAAQKSLDSLELKILTTTGINKIDLLLDLSEAYLNQQPQRTADLANEALELSVALNDLSRQAKSISLIGDAHWMKGDNIEALDLYFQSDKIYKQISDNKGLANCANSIGRIYRLLGEYASSLEFHLTALNIYEELNDEAGIASSLINSGVAYRNLGNKDLALENYAKALEISSKLNDLSNKVSALISIGNVYWYDNDNIEALSYYEKALATTQENNYQGQHSGGVLNNIGNVHRNLGDLDKALDYYSQALKISQEIGDQNQIAITLKNIGIANKELMKYSEAIRCLNESKTLAESIHFLKVQREALEQLSLTYTLLADYKKALEYYKEFSLLKDSLFDEETSNKISLLQLKNNLREKESQNTIIQKDTALKTSKERNLRNIIIFISLFAATFIFFLWRRYRSNIKKNEELQVLNSELEKRVEDRTKLLRIENEQRRIAQEQAEMANDTKNRFLATISHEVRTPINAIIGFCDLAIKADFNDDHQLHLKRVKDSSEHLLAMIKDVLDYSQIESGKMELKMASFDIYNLITSVVNAYYLDASSKNIKLTFSIADKIPKFLIGDPDALRQVLYNLIGNAIKFTDKGTVEVLVKQVDLINGSDSISLFFSVKDSGIGISKLKQKLIFMDFTQVDNTASRRYGGVGLGLTISKYFVELMGGKISVQSEKGAGSEFTFQITLQTDSDKTGIKVKKQAAIKKKLHLLVAEDNLLNCHVIAAFLNRLGHTSKIVNNGRFALDILSKEDFDAVLMDIEMPEMDGIEATEAIRKGLENVRNPKIPIIALTAHALRDYEEKSYKAGMDSYLTKPVDIEKLSEVLQSVSV
jgi:signal transduction histidine kinase/ActR/RegA family two-component response regulator